MAPVWGGDVTLLQVYARVMRRALIACCAAGFVAVIALALVLLEPRPVVLTSSAPSFMALTAEDAPSYTFAVAGDSITAYDNHEMPGCADACVLSERTWTYWAQSPALRLVGGYAESGNKSWETAARMPAVDADVLVIALGTNDATTASDPAVLLSQLDLIIATAGARSVLIAAIPPHELAPAAAAANNAALNAYAHNHGYGFVDPWITFRSGEHWLPGVSGDGIHPSEVGTFQAAGARIAAAMLAMETTTTPPDAAR